MIPVMKIVAMLLLTALLLTGCGSSEPAQTTAAPVTTEAPSETTLPEVPAITVTFEHVCAEGTEYARITGTDDRGSQVWSLETTHYQLSQLDRVSDVGSWQGRYYYVEDGTVVALNIADGSVLWTNADFGGCPAGKAATLIEENGTVYLCGFFGPDFFGVNAQGKTIQRMDTLDPDYYWAYRLEKTDAAIVVHLSGGPEGDMGDPGYLFYIDLPIPQE